MAKDGWAAAFRRAILIVQMRFSKTGILNGLFWLAFAIVTIALYVGLKAYERSLALEHAGKGTFELLALGLVGRLNDFSFMMIVCALTSILLFSLAIRQCFDFYRAQSFFVNVTWLTALTFLALVGIEWALYISAVARDRGTFFFAFERTRDLPTIPNPMPVPSSDYRLYVDQVVEGTLNLLMIGVAVAWVVLTWHAITSATRHVHRRPPSAAMRFWKWGSFGVTFTLFPALVGIYGFLVANGVVSELFEGIKSKPAAVLTAGIMWAIFVAIGLRILFIPTADGLGAARGDREEPE